LALAIHFNQLQKI